MSKLLISRILLQSRKRVTQYGGSFLYNYIYIFLANQTLNLLQNAKIDHFHQHMLYPQLICA